MQRYTEITRGSVLAGRFLINDGTFGSMMVKKNLIQVHGEYLIPARSGIAMKSTGNRGFPGPRIQFYGKELYENPPAK